MKAGSVWTPVSNFGWQVLQSATGYVTYYHGMALCKLDNQMYDKYYGWHYFDVRGTEHNFGTFAISDASQLTQCTSGGPPYSGSAVANDGSGYTLTVDAGDGSGPDPAKLTAPSGWTYNPPYGIGTGTASLSDSNGNTISAVTTYNSQTQTYTITFTDTLNTTPVTVTSPAAPSSTTYSFPSGSGSQVTATVSYTNYTIETNFGCSGITDYGRTTQMTANLVNGITLPDNTSYSFSYEPTVSPNHAGAVTGRIRSITLPTGGTITYQYYTGSTPANDITCADGSASVLQRFTPDTGSSHSWLYQHSENGTAWTTTLTDPQTNVTTLNFQGIYETERQVAGLATIYTCYGTSGGSAPASPCNSAAVNLPVTQVAVTTSIGSVESETVTDYDWNSTTGISYGLPIEVDEYDWGPTLKGKTVTAYNYNTSCGVTNTAVLSRPCSIKIEDGTSNLKAETDNTYDANGNLTQETHQNTNGSPGSISRYFTYSSSGVVQTTKDFNGDQTSYTNNGCSGAFPTTVTLPSPFSFQSSIGYDTGCNGAVATSTTNINGQQTTFTYNDPFWRVTEVDYPNTGWTKYAYNPYNGSQDANVVTSVRLTSSANHQYTQTFDGLGRVVKAQDNSAGTEVDTTYDSLGRLYSVSNPYASTSDPTYGLTYYSYDALGRTTKVTYPDSSYSTVSYSNNCATLTDAASKVRKVCTDGLGRTTSVTEDPSGLNYSTTYTYDALNDLTGVTQTSQTRTYAYDMLSRLTSVAMPETNQCAITFGYDANGNVTSRSAPKEGQTSCSTKVTTTYAYDNLNRLASKSYNDGITANVTYTYDESSCLGLSSCWNVGYRTSMSDGAGSEHWAHDRMGRIDADQRTTNSQTKTFQYSYSYDPSTGVWAIDYPDGRVLNYGFDSAGRLASASDSSYNYAQSAGYYAPGELNTLTVGESGSYNIGLTQTYNSRLQPVNLTASTPGGSVLNLTYGFNLGSSDNGNVMSITNNRDTTHNRDQTFTYDSLNRIATGSTGATSNPNCWGVNFNIDRYGNLQSTTTLSGYSNCTQYFLSLAVSASTNQVTSSGFGYDAAGNTTNDGPGGYTYTYDAEGRQLSAGGVNYSYDGDGRRVKKDNGTLYWYDLSGNVLTETALDGTSPVDYIYFGGSRLARLPSSGPYYYLGDALGSSRVMVQGGQNSACYEADFEPYGRPHEITNTCSQHYKFTGMEQDSETSLNAGGNDHTWFRQYPPNLGRWLSPDPLAGDITNPQSLNRYAYVINNPMRFTDQSGLSPRRACLFQRRPKSNFFDACGNGPFDGGSSSGGYPGGGDNGGGGGSWLPGDDAAGIFPVEGGYTIFDAVAGVPGTYLTFDEYGHVGFGFSEDLWQQTWGFIDSERVGFETMGADPGAVPTSGYMALQTAVGGCADLCGLIPDIERLNADTNQFINAILPQSYRDEYFGWLAQGQSPGAAFNQVQLDLLKNQASAYGFSLALSNEQDSVIQETLQVVGTGGGP